jgi:hypothetical protein
LFFIVRIFLPLKFTPYGVMRHQRPSARRGVGTRQRDEASKSPLGGGLMLIRILRIDAIERCLGVDCPQVCLKFFSLHSDPWVRVMIPADKVCFSVRGPSGDRRLWRTRSNHVDRKRAATFAVAHLIDLLHTPDEKLAEHLKSLPQNEASGDNFATKQAKRDGPRKKGQKKIIVLSEEQGGGKKYEEQSDGEANVSLHGHLIVLLVFIQTSPGLLRRQACNTPPDAR